MTDTMAEHIGLAVESMAIAGKPVQVDMDIGLLKVVREGDIYKSKIERNKTEREGPGVTRNSSTASKSGLDTDTEESGEDPENQDEVYILTYDSPRLQPRVKQETYVAKFNQTIYHRHVRGYWANRLGHSADEEATIALDRMFRSTHGTRFNSPPSPTGPDSTPPDEQEQRPKKIIMLHSLRKTKAVLSSVFKPQRAHMQTGRAGQKPTASAWEDRASEEGFD
ncbi:uncharacterized protein K452DRAFT_320180 [Aplosporella prunicola CBS 121167]|uniref:Uncharacterized protein n=1 Tax=Aplosporella prunicola CBS 121167 TaxID=1176127 RepID=A0A6A6B5V6_9PEZI|nr:uncharacterized protein K452DRAFT_320180 [Aplosporella prunicola CBS 121167]KAF2139512.1 hypothetical protein K452DRAFT_320180 [Aplosporella prunicola CBS 121167]